MELRPRHLTLALLLHAMVFTFLFVGVRCSRTVPPPAAIEGVLVSQAPVPRVQRKPEPVQSRPRPKPPSRIEPPAPLPRVSEPTPKSPQQTVRESELAAATETMTAARKQMQRQAEQAAKQKAQREEREKVRAAEQQRRLEEQKKRAAAERAKRERQRAQAEAQRNLQQQLAAATLQQAIQQNVQRQQNAWADQLTAAIRGNWVRPPAFGDHFKCSVHMELLPNGQVVSVSIRRSCGSPALDDSVVRAVNKSSPLPLPQDPGAFDPHVTINFCPHASDCTQ